MRENGQKSPSYRAIVEKIRAYGRKKRRVQIISGLFRFLACGTVLVLALLVVESILFLPPLPRQILLGFGAAIGIFCFIRQFLFSGNRFILKGAGSTDHLATEIGEAFPDVKDSLVDALQIFREIENNRENYSPELAEASLSAVSEKISPKDFQALVSGKAVAVQARNFATALLGLLLLALPFHKSFETSLSHFAHPTRPFRPLAVQAIRVTPGDWQCLSGDTLLVKVSIDGTYRGPVQIFWKEKSKKEGHTETAPADSFGRYHFRLERLRESLSYYVKAGKAKTRPFRVSVEKRPLVRSLQAELIFPRYTGLSPKFLEENEGQITALRGTRVKLHIKASKPLKKAEIVFQKRNVLPLRILNQEAHGKFTIHKNDVYFIRLWDQKGYTNAEPIRYKIAVVPDQPPVVQIQQPGQDVDLTQEMILPLQIQAEDDFGFSGAKLFYRVHHAVQVTQQDTFFVPIDLSLAEQKGTQLQMDYTWQLTGLQLLPGDFVEYFVKVWDNDAVSGFKSASSRTYLARFPSMAEIYHETTAAQDESVQELEELVRESKELRRQVDKVTGEMKRNPKMNWTKQQQLQDLAQKQQRLAQKAGEIRKNLDATMDRLQKNNMVSEETIQKYMEIQKLFNEVLTPEMKKILAELQKALQKMNPRKLNQSANKFRMSEDNFQQSLERTLNLLKRLQIEQKLDQAKKMAENLAERQQSINRSLKKAASNQERQALKQLEEKLRKETERFRKQLKQIQKEMTEFPDMHAAKMNPAIGKAQEAGQSMQRMQSALSQGQQNQAEQSGQQSHQSLQQLGAMLNQMKKNLVNKQKNEIMQQLARTSSEMLRLSKEQEALQKQTGQLSPMSRKFNQIAEQQLSLLNNLNLLTKGLYQLSQKTFFVTPEIGKAVGKALGNMQEALRQMEERNGRGAAGRQRMAMGALNEAVLNIEKSMQGLAAASSSVGMEEYLRQLQKMAGQQQGINQQSLQLSLKLGKNGRLTESEQGRLRRLAAQQRALQKALEQLRQNAGQHSNVLGDLQKMAKDMGDVAKRLEMGQLNRETLRRQQKILSRLLDAQRSVRQRDYSRKRRSEAGKAYVIRRPGALPREVLQQKDQLQEDILRARKAGYSEDFIQLIQAYYQALYKNKVETP